LVGGRIYYGWLPDLTVGEFVDRHSDIVARLPFILVSSIDSESAVSKMPWVQRYLADDPSWAVLNNPLIISGERLLAAAKEKKLFTGFDEIWVPERVPVSPPPSYVSLVAPNVFDVLPHDIGQWLSQSGYRLGLGDGDGLNYVGTDPALARELDLPFTDRKTLTQI
jgi:hypothetical protein